MPKPATRRSTNWRARSTETSIFGITTNQSFLARLIELPETRNATFHTRLIDEQIDQLADKTKGPGVEALALGAYFWMMRQRPPATGNPSQNPWHVARNHGLADVGR